MKLQKLTIHNIASIEDAEIDFEAQPLVDSDVFLITGKTGSGKSTILDAICLALYNNTPRLKELKMDGKTKDVDVDVTLKNTCQLLRRNTGDSFVKLTFTGSNDVHYEVEWEWHRADHKPSGNLQKKQWILTNCDTGHKYTKANEIMPEIDAATGLTFDQFCRTTLLAQGEFTQFLNSSDNEKADILKKITKVDIYSKIGKKVNEVYKEKENKRIIAEGNLKGVSTLPEEEVAALKAAIEECDAENKDLEAEWKRDNDKLQWIKNEVVLNKALLTAEKNYNEAKLVVEAEEFKANELLVNQWNTTIEARGWLAAQKKAEADKTKLQGDLAALKGYYLSVLGGYAFEKQKKLLAESQLAKLPELKADDEAKAQEDLKCLRLQFDNAKKQKHTIETAEERIATLDNEKQRRTKAAQNLEATLKKIVEKEQKTAAMEQPIDEARKKMDLRRNLYEKQREITDVFIQLMCQNLHVGDTCPICRQTINSELPREEELTRQVNLLFDDFKEAEKACNDLLEERKNLLADIRAYRESYNRDKTAFDNDHAVETAAQRAQQACNDCGIRQLDDTTPKQLQALKDNIDAEIRSLEGKIPSMEQKVKDNRETAEKRNLLTLQITRTETLLATVDEAVESLRQDMPEWTVLESAAAETRDLSRIANELRSRVHTTLQLLNQAEKAVGDNSRNLALFLADHPEIGIDRLLVLGSKTQRTIEDIGTRIKQSRDNLLARKTRRDDAEKELSGHLKNKPELTEEDTAEALALRIADKVERMRLVSQKKGGIEQQLKTDDENRRRQGELLKELEQREADSNKWARLDSIIGDATGNKFCRIAQSYILGSLIHSANRYMKDLYDRYTLRVDPGTFVIMVEDAYQGYTSRPASTVSGGESFLVSLALALALSDIGDKLAVDTLFIDEGFGTLSGEPLQNAIATLRKLQTQSGRHVGIISHIEELRERIPVQIQLIQEGNNSSSTVKVV